MESKQLQGVTQREDRQHFSTRDRCARMCVPEVREDEP